MKDDRPATCELVNTYEILEHVMGIDGLHPHSLSTIDDFIRRFIARLPDGPGIVLDIGCGNGLHTRSISKYLPKAVSITGIDINKIAISEAIEGHEAQDGLSFFHGTLEEFYAQQSDQRIVGIIMVSVSMFMPALHAFYATALGILEEGGVLADAPFLFKQHSTVVPNSFKAQTYAICGCNMNMYSRAELEEKMKAVGFSVVESGEGEFELMNLACLFKDYPAWRLIGNFIKNILKPKFPLDHVSRQYLLGRTLKIFDFFMRNRKRYSAGHVLAVKATDTALARLSQVSPC